MIKWIKSILIAIILFASIITIFDFADGILRNKEEKPVNQPATLAEKSPQKKEVTRYGTVYRFSTSGEMGFYYYDMEKGSVVANWQAYPWFWAGVDNTNDDEKVDNFSKYVNEHENYVFKIVGEKEADDCDFYQNEHSGVCLEVITVKKIIAVQKNKGKN